VLPAGLAAPTTVIEGDVYGGPPWEVLPVSSAAPTIIVGEDVDGGPPGRCCGRAQQRSPPLLKETSMAGPLEGAAGGSGSIHHCCWRRHRWGA
jgi:hypothetical protein